MEEFCLTVSKLRILIMICVVFILDTSDVVSIYKQVSPGLEAARLQIRRACF